MVPINPYSDEYMQWRPDLGRYVITEAALESNGVNIRSRLADSGADATTIINAICKDATTIIYGYIHSFAYSNAAQDGMIAHCKPFRDIIYRALCEQAEYLCRVGNLYQSADESKRALAVSETAKQELAVDIPGLGSILYAGR